MQICLLTAIHSSKTSVVLIFFFSSYSVAIITEIFNTGTCTHRLCGSNALYILPVMLFTCLAQGVVFLFVAQSYVSSTTKWVSSPPPQQQTMGRGEFISTWLLVNHPRPQSLLLTSTAVSLQWFLASGRIQWWIKTKSPHELSPSMYMR